MQAGTEQLIMDQMDWLYGLCLRLERRRQDADDLFQDTCLRALERAGTYDGGRPLRPWLARVCVNTYRDGLRRLTLRLRHSQTRGDVERDWTETLPSATPGPAEQAVDNAFKEALVRCLDTLDDKYRVPLVLQYYEGVGYDEISRLLGLNPGTVKSRMNEAKKRLRKQMEEMGYAR